MDAAPAPLAAELKSIESAVTPAIMLPPESVGEVPVIFKKPIAVGSLAASLAVYVSPPPETVAMLITLEGALAATSTVSVKAG